MIKELVKEDMICIDCIGDQEIKKRIRTTTKEGVCVSCNNDSIGISLEELASWVDEVYRKYYQPGPFSLGVPGVSYQRGSFPEDIIESILEVDYDISVFLTEFLREQERYDVYEEGATALYASGRKYIMNDTHPYELHETWRHFRHRVQFERRFFDDYSKVLLESLFEGIDFFRSDSMSPDEELKPGDYIYRARIASTLEEVKEILDGIPITLGPPPSKWNKGGRMNPSGISVFYGAFAKETCIAEVRPVVGGFVVLGKFEALQSIRLFDLTKFISNFPNVSMFSEDYQEIMNCWRFFKNFHYLISEPIQPFEEFLEYVPTQMVSEFLANELKYDGIVYSSAQFCSEAIDNLSRVENIALFNAENIIQIEEVAEDKNEVWEKTGNIKRPLNLSETLENIGDKQFVKKPILKLVSNSAEFYSIKSVRYEYERKYLNVVDY